MTVDEVEFVVRWLGALQEMHPDARASVNAVSIRLTGMYISVDAAGRVEVAKVESTSAHWRD